MEVHMEGQDADHPVSSSAGYGSILLPTSETPSATVEVVRPGSSRELATISTNDSPLHQGDDLEVGGELERELIDYMEEQTSQIEFDLRKILAMGQVDENLSNGAPVSSPAPAMSLNDDDFLVVDEDHFAVTESKVLSVEEERELYKSATESLQKMRQEILGLKRHLESECRKLDILLMLSIPGKMSLRLRKFFLRLDRHLEQTTDTIEDIVRKYNRIVDGVRQNKDHMENPVNYLIRKSPIDCVTWLHAVLFLVLLGTIGFMYMWARSSSEWTVYLRLLRSPLLVVLLLYLYGINMKVWAKFRVDYATIFSHLPSATPTPKYLLKMASILTVLMTLVVIAVMIATPFSAKLPIKVAPLIMWLILFAFLFNPFDVLEFDSTFSELLFVSFCLLLRLSILRTFSWPISLIAALQYFWTLSI